MTGLREIIIMRVYTSRHTTVDEEKERDDIWREWVKEKLIKALGEEKAGGVRIELVRKSVLWDRGREEEDVGMDGSKYTKSSIGGSVEEQVTRWDIDSVPHWMAQARREELRKSLERKAKYR
jgi:hypothetical protein